MADKFSHNMLPDNCKDTLIVMEEKKEKDKEFAECGGLLSQMKRLSVNGKASGKTKLFHFRKRGIGPRLPGSEQMKNIDRSVDNDSF